MRAEGGDLFGWGAREAVLRAVRADPGDAAPFGDPVDATTLAELVNEALGPRGTHAEVVAADEVSCSGSGPHGGLAALAFAHGWHAEGHDSTDRLRLRPATP